MYKAFISKQSSTHVQVEPHTYENLVIYPSEIFW